MKKFMRIQADGTEEIIINLDDVSSIYRSGKKLWVSYISSGYSTLTFSEKQSAIECMDSVILIIEKFPSE